MGEFSRGELASAHFMHSLRRSSFVWASIAVPSVSISDEFMMGGATTRLLFHMLVILNLTARKGGNEGGREGEKGGEGKCFDARHKPAAEA